MVLGFFYKEQWNMKWLVSEIKVETEESSDE